jgi:hypothetical protein
MFHFIVQHPLGTFIARSETPREMAELTREYGTASNIITMPNNVAKALIDAGLKVIDLEEPK